nr:sigma factor-like helix-turn-helix DNA-binding protein [Halarsenatibacter silvermanii]
MRLKKYLNFWRSRTLKEIGREFDVTRERIRQIEARALKKLENLQDSEHLKEFLVL